MIDGNVIRVIVESPFAGATARIAERNIRCLRACLRDSLLRGESPFASHGLYALPGVLDDVVPSEREMGILAGFGWRSAAEKTVVYEDFGVTPGMQRGIAHAREIGQVVETRRLFPMPEQLPKGAA